MERINIFTIYIFILNNLNRTLMHELVIIYNIGGFTMVMSEKRPCKLGFLVSEIS